MVYVHAMGLRKQQERELGSSLGFADKARRIGELVIVDLIDVVRVESGHCPKDL